MSFLFDSFEGWKAIIEEKKVSLFQPVIEYEINEKGSEEQSILLGLEKALDVMFDAVDSGLTEDMVSRSGMINNGAKKVYNHGVSVLGENFQKVIARALAAKEVNSCMGRVVAAPTAGASGIIPGVLYTLKDIHSIEKKTLVEALLVSAGIGLIIDNKASLAGAVGGCQAETGSAAAMASGAIVYCLGGDFLQVSNAVGITIQCMLGLVCDPVAGLVEVPCVVRNASAAAIAFSSAQIAMAGVDAVIPVDECIEAMGEIGQSMEERYKETALGGLAATKTGKALSKKILISDIQILGEEEVLPEKPSNKAC
ncbi:MAG: L-serine ammonia-lyase, iron-sulfur-dependent, subunit alpha [Cyclobacteriaceae bacterium]|nr:L-serine ammonia-lyase, iron-sulfur-dependent, subunit alpha [Cyclobacteriaceae bacterium]